VNYSEVLKLIYKHGKTEGLNFNKAEYRIHLLYEWDTQGRRPWNWDYKNYNRRKEMIGFYFPEDLSNIEQIEDLKIERFKEEERLNAHSNKK